MLKFHSLADGWGYDALENIEGRSGSRKQIRPVGGETRGDGRGGRVTRLAGRVATIRDPLNGAFFALGFEL